MTTQTPTFRFERKSNSFFDWFGNRIKANDYHKCESMIIEEHDKCGS